MSTRIIVKNLPHNITASRLKSHFSSSQSGNAHFSGSVTDAKLVTDSKSGKSRGFAFIGYRTNEEAQKAVEWYNGTFVDMRKVSVELAKLAGDESLGQSWRDKNKEYIASKKRAQVDESDDKTVKRKRKEGGRGKEDDEKAAIIKELTRRDRKNKLLSQNPDLEKAQKAAVPTPESATIPEESKKRKRDKKDKTEGSKKSARIEEPPSVVEVVYDDSIPRQPASAEDEPAEQPAVSDLDWLRSRTSRTLGLQSDSEESDNEKSAESESEDERQTTPVSSDDETEEPSNKEISSPAEVAATTEPDAPTVSAAEAKIIKTGRLFVRNLVYGVTEEDLRNVFSPHGQIEEIHIPLGNNQEPLPMAFIQFSDPNEAVLAYQELDGIDLQGRLMHIIPGEQKRMGKDDNLEGKTLKERREIERRQQAGRGGDWGTLFMNQDAVMASLAARYGVPKSDLLLASDSSSTDPAVKAAMAETTILTETRIYLTENGVNLSSLTSSQKDRSDNVIIAKNFPYGTTREELVSLFGGPDQVKRLLLPPAGTIAFIEFYDSGQARAAFKRLAYRRFKDAPLYLEKAPKGIFVVEPDKKVTTSQSKTGSNDIVDDTEDPGSTLYIKNLDFSTTQAGLTNAFKSFPGFRLATIKTKPPNSKGERLSMGFGFVTFQSKETASVAMSAEITLDGRKLELKFARQTPHDIVKPSSKKSAAGRKKIAIKNLGFSVTKKDIRELFGSYGHIQSLRLPKKFDNTPRGFAFVEFTSASDAAGAMEALKHSHLLGRHLVLEWAEEEDGLEKLRVKTREVVEASEVGKLMGKGNVGGRIGDVLED